MAERFPALTKEQIAEARKKAGLPEEIPIAPSSKRNRAEALNEDIRILLTKEIDGLRVAVQSTNSRLFNMQKPDANRLHFPGAALPSFSTEQIRHAEDDLLGNKIRLQCLEESLEALTNNQPLPADLRKTLQILESESDPGSARQKSLHALLIQLP
ncbi:MAG: hypothetical protein WC766_04670 [Patescibacteria group bacterium]|jgi:hypothetical protein